MIVRGEGQVKQTLVNYQELDVDVIEGFLNRTLSFLTRVTSTGMPFLLLPTSILSQL